jgi:hypothetical protein
MRLAAVCRSTWGWATCRRLTVAQASDRIEGAIRLQGVECDAVGDGRVTEIGPDIACRHGDASVQPMCRGESFDHGDGHAASFNPVMLLEQCHRPRQLPHRKNLDLVWQCGDLRAKSALDVSWQSGNRFGELAGHNGIGKGGAQPKEPQSGSRNAVRRKTPQVRRPLARQDVTQKVVVDDDGCQLRGRQIGIVELADQLAMLLSRQCVGEELLTAAGR